MVYNLTEQQIEDILKEGKFDKEKYADYISIISFNVGDSVNDYEQNDIIPLIKNKNELYKRIINCDPLRDSTYDAIYDDIEYCIAEAVEEITQLIDQGDAI